MPETGYILAVLAVGFVITLALRALPFAILRPLSRSAFVRAMALWMPAGILAILAAATFRGSATGGPGHLGAAVAAATVTVVLHLTCGRRTLLSVGGGTLVFVAVVNLL